MPSCKGLAVPANMGWIRGPCVLQVAKMPQTRPSPLPACAWSKLVPCRDGLTRYYDQKAFGWGCLLLLGVCGFVWLLGGRVFVSIWGGMTVLSCFFK